MFTNSQIDYTAHAGFVASFAALLPVLFLGAGFVVGFVNTITGYHVLVHKHKGIHID